MSCIVQWNCQGFRSKKDELLDMINVQNPYAVALQETKLFHNARFRVPNYTLYRKEGHYNNTRQGGVAELVHQSIPANLLVWNTEYLAIAVRINYSTSITLCSIFTSRNQILYQSLYEFLVQLLPPVVMMGDFNSYNQMWGCTVTDVRGRLVEEVVNQLNLSIINDGNPLLMIIIDGTESCIKISIVTP